MRHSVDYIIANRRSSSSQRVEKTRIFRRPRLRLIPAWPGEPHRLRDSLTGTFGDDGNTITGQGQLSQDGHTWDNDLDLNYQRVA